MVKYIQRLSKFWIVSVFLPFINAFIFQGNQNAQAPTVHNSARVGNGFLELGCYLSTHLHVKIRSGMHQVFPSLQFNASTASTIHLQ
jgi:hypothetical protein